MDDHFKEHKAALLKVLKATEIFKQDNIPCQIEEGLYLGSLGAANTRSTLKRLNITHILSITSSPPSHPDDFVYKTILVPDKLDANISQYFDECFTFIDEAKTSGRGVLVHCFAGKSRSVTVVVAYLMFKNGKSLSEAMGYVKLKRPVASPNSGFMLQLEEYEKSRRDAESKNGAGHRAQKCGSSL
ncbi:dual specificity protein phosphatase 1 [Phtheirospermum japonicum]|uniref:Dual specificity protein phosphatase 1 n=1 Tax=Phtheirospermum japonicum TaxID=374723 RepID=A0A830BFD3_9LAMI|nr:dual specificity protein phosphatase 1 [Phtheirospermum japonicum]